MRVFVTGAPGFIGRAVTTELLSHGHTVLGLARSDANASILTNLGAGVHRGDMEDLDSIRSGAALCDGVIHLAFIHDFADYIRANRVDYAAIEAMGEVLAGSGKPLIIASGTMMAPKGQLADEDTEAEKGTLFAERAKAANLVYALSREKNIRGIVIRLPPTVHGTEDKGMIPRFLDAARNNGLVTHIGEGSARWPAVHRLDAAVLYRLALEKGRPGATYNAVGEEGVSMKSIMDLAGKKLDLPVEGKAVEEVVGSLGLLAYALGADNPTRSEKTQKQLGWEPKQLGLLEDLEANYFS